MKIMTFNVRYDNETDGDHAWSKRQGAFLRMIRKHRADVIGTQETTDRIQTFLKRNAKGYLLVGDGRNADRTGERCTVMVRKAAYNVIETETVWLNGDYHKAGDQDPREGFARICTMVVIQDKKTGVLTRIFNAHLAYQNEDVILRNGQQLFNYIDSFKETKIPFVLMGDFNSNLSRPLHQPFLSRYKEAYLSLNQARPNTFHAYGDPQGIDAIDFIYTDVLTFISVTTDTSRFDGLYPSDHYPVIAELT